MIPLALFVYARPEHTRRTLDALAANLRAPEFALTVFSDGPRSEAARPAVEETRRAVRERLARGTRFGRVEIVESQVNRGLAPSIIAGVTALLGTDGRIVVVEDDLVTAPGFLGYMADALDAYAETPEVFSVTGWNPGPQVLPFPADFSDDVYFNPRSSSWGWGTWADRWAKVDFDVADYPAFKASAARQLGFNQGGDDLTEMLYQERECGLGSWSIRMSYAHFRHHALCVYPRFSLLENIGLDGTGEHCGTAPHLMVDLDRAKAAHVFPGAAFVDPRLLDAFRATYRRPHSGLIGDGARAYWAGLREPADTLRLDLAVRYLDGGRLDQAKRLLDEHVAALPDDPEAFALYGRLALAVDHPAAAAPLFRTALRGWCDLASARQGLAEAEARLNPHPGEAE